MPLDSSAVAAIVAHMNDDHADAVLGYVRRFHAATAADSAELVTLDEHAMLIRVTAAGAQSEVRIAFDHPLADAGDARDTLIAMARETH